MNARSASGPAMGRAYTYRELPLGAVSVGVHADVIPTGNWRIQRPVFRTGTPPCSEACPAGVDVRGFIARVKEGHFAAAHQLYREENPFPAICGRVCDHPCEGACNREELDRAVSVNALERFVADFTPAMEKAESAGGTEVAVVGSGPAGLAAAYFLTRLGHRVTVFEARERLGGLLSSCIPQYRLPPAVVEQEVEKLGALGIRFRTNQPIDSNSWDLLDEFGAVVLACGAGRSYALPIDGMEADTQGIQTGRTFLQAAKRGQAVSSGERVVVIGGGNTAVDAARVARRQGASAVVLYRRDRQEMPAFDSEVADALEEGVELVFLATPTRVETHGSGLRIRCVRNRPPSEDEAGRARPIPVEGSEFRLDADTLITAVGEGLDAAVLPSDIRLSGQGVKVVEWGATSRAGVFACGDAIDQPRSVAHAIGSGKCAALGVDAYCRGRATAGLLDALRTGEHGTVSFRRYLSGEHSPEDRRVIHAADLNLDLFSAKDRAERPKIALAARTATAEVVGCLAATEALGEAERCFGCGQCSDCDNCIVFCPDGSVVRETDGTLRTIDYEYCKGCGICENECPVGVVAMEKDG